VACVVAGLTYRWLSDRFQEWLAELAEQELLTTMDNDAQVDGVEGSKPSKSAKKSKKKKEKKAASANSKATDTVPAKPIPTADDNEIRDARSNPEMSSTSTDSDEIEDLQASSVQVNGDKSSTALEADKVQSPEASVSEARVGSSSSLEPKVDFVNDYTPQVGVELDSAFESAEAYLVGRLQSLLESKNVVIIS